MRYSEGIQCLMLGQFYFLTALRYRSTMIPSLEDFEVQYK